MSGMGGQIAFGIGLAGVVLAVAGVWLLGGGLWRLARGRVFSGTLGSLSGALLVTLIALAGALLLELYTYHRLGAEQQIAELRFERVGPRQFDVTLIPAHAPVRQIVLEGDEWQLDARVIKWKALARLLGFDTLYRLQRISGRYRDIQAEQAQPHSAIALDDDSSTEAWRMTSRAARYLPGFDASYGSATYLPMADGAVFSVSLGGSGLIARPENNAAREAVAQW